MSNRISSPNKKLWMSMAGGTFEMYVPIWKVNILNHAAHYTPDNKAKYLTKAREIYQYTIQNLTDNLTRSYSRILAILLQNPVAAADLESSHNYQQCGPIIQYEPVTEPSVWRIVANVWFELKRVMSRFSIENESIWLNKHSAKFRERVGDIR